MPTHLSDAGAQFVGRFEGFRGHLYDALVSFVYNLGAGAFEGSTLLKDLNARNFAAVPGQLEEWVHAGPQVLAGLVTRRKAEARLFTTGHYS